MKIIRVELIILCLIILMTQTTACWNYRDIERMSIAVGFAIDQDPKTGLYTLTAEVVEILLGANEKQISTKLLSSEGETLFDAARNLVSISGRKLYWSHAKVMIIGNEIAKKGIIPALDFVRRDAEPRRDIDLLISEGKGASIFEECHNSSSGIISYRIYETMNAQKSLSKAPMADEWEFSNDLQDQDYSAIAPVIKVVEKNEEKMPKVEGTGIFKQDKLVGYLDGDETKTLRLIKNETKGGLFVVKSVYKDSEAKVILEIFDHKTKIKPQVLENKFVMKINMQSVVTIGENTGSIDFNKEEHLKELKTAAEKEQEEKVQKLIKKVQIEFGTDIFGFGNVLNTDLPSEWDKVKDHWDAVFVLVKVEVKEKVNIRNTGFASSPIKVGGKD